MQETNFAETLAETQTQNFVYVELKPKHSVFTTQFGVLYLSESDKIHNRDLKAVAAKL